MFGLELGEKSQLLGVWRHCLADSYNAVKAFLTKADFQFRGFSVFVLTWPIFRGPGPGFLGGTRSIEYVEMSIPLHPVQPILAPPIGHCSERGRGDGDACYFEKHDSLFFKALVQFT